MTNLKTYCVSNLANSNLEKLDLTLVGVGENEFPQNYITCKKGENIQNKEKYYSELTFHYWFWKNELKNMNDDIWIGSNIIIQELKDYISTDSGKTEAAPGCHDDTVMAMAIGLETLRTHYDKLTRDKVPWSQKFESFEPDETEWL